MAIMAATVWFIPGWLRTAWGRESEMRAAFEKVKQQLK